MMLHRFAIGILNPSFINTLNGGSTTARSFRALLALTRLVECVLAPLNHD
jgi:hypothetical protein